MARESGDAPFAGSPRLSAAPLLFAAALGFASGDALRPAAQQWGARMAVLAIDGYRATLSPLIAKSGLAQCRFQPTCSEYGRIAFARYGTARGAWLTAGRVLRCQPFSKGGYDPVP